VLAYVGLLYKIEREARDRKLNADHRPALRQAKSRPILDDLKKYLETEKRNALPNSPMGDAIDYALKNWEALCLWQVGLAHFGGLIWPTPRDVKVKRTEFRSAGA
jgi:hypothetical protein